MKEKYKDQIKDLLNISKKVEAFMSISIYLGKGLEPCFYKKIPNEFDIDVNVMSEVSADKLIAFLTRLESGASIIEYHIP